VGLKFNPQKTQCIAFGCNSPSAVNITLNFDKLEWCNSLKYLGCYFQPNSCRVVIRKQMRKYYRNFNNIMSVIGKGRNEVAAVHLIKCYCVMCTCLDLCVWNMANVISGIPSCQCTVE